MPVIMIHTLELTEEQKKIMAQKYTKIMSELTNVPEDKIYVFFAGYALDGIAAGGMLNSELPESILKMFKIKYSEELISKQAIRVLSLMKIKAGMEERAQELMLKFVTKTREEKGCLGYDCTRSDFDLLSEKPQTSYFIFKEKWLDMDAIGYHISSDWFKEFMGEAANFCEGPIEVTKRIDAINKLEIVDFATKVKIELRVHAKPEKAEAVKDGLAAAMKMMSAMPGCVSYDLYQGFEGIFDPNVFITDQIWENMDLLSKAIEHLMKNMPFSTDDLAEPIQEFVFKMCSEPAKK
jgi:quinol monooxygenase YgiN/phenylpyruvate tautomerase PptA (4-oxalocrotonate tautomerase family)